MKSTYTLVLRALIFVLLSAPFLSKSQGLNYEKGYNNTYGIFDASVAANADHSYIAFSEAFGFWYDTRLIKLDSDGNEVYATTYETPGTETNFLKEMFPMSNGDLVLHNTGAYTCDVIGHHSAWARLNAQGDVLWETVFTSFGGFDDFNTGTMLGTNIFDNELIGLLWQDTEEEQIVYRMNADNGELLDSIPTVLESPWEFLGFEKYNNDYYGYSSNKLFKFLPEFYIDFSVPVDGNVKGVKQNDGLFYVLTDNAISIFDDGLNLIFQNDLTGYSQMRDLKIQDNLVSFLARQNDFEVHLIQYDLQLQSSDTEVYEIPSEYYVADYNTDELAILEEYELTLYRSVRFRDMLRNGEDMEVPQHVDIAINEIIVNEYELIPFDTWDGTAYIAVGDVSVEVLNNSDHVLNSFNLNKYLEPGICSPFMFFQNYTDLEIEPGESVWIEIEDIELNSFVTLEDGAADMEVCMYSSHPNDLVDLNVENDEWCTITSVTVGVEEVTLSNITTYPNPTTGILQIEGAPARATYLIMDMTGRLIAQGSLLNNRLDVSHLVNGMYQLRIADAQTGAGFSQKIVKE